MSEAASALAGDRKRPLLAAMRGTKNVTIEARAHLAAPQTSLNIIAIAVLVDSPISRIIVHFFLNVNRPTIPIREFPPEEEALTWLKGFLK
ncbi:MAG: hypothetical protein H6636_13775 [Anaerolineales bacterium]|nr:hypothetical protein [Anaerolineales bacterium]